jgi:hypothetical protein
MSKYFTWILVFVLGLNTISLAQKAEVPTAMLQQLTASGYDNYYLQYDRTPYFAKDWCESDITVTSGEVYENVKIKYDLYKGYIVYYNPILKKQLVIDNEIIESVVFKLPEQDRVYNLVNYCVNDSLNKPKCRFYFNLVDDSIGLWSAQDKKVNVYTDVSSGYGKLGEYYARIKYYLVVNDEFVSLPKNKRNLLKLYPNSKKELTQFIRKRKLVYKDEVHLMRIIQELNVIEKASKKKQLIK